MKQKASDSIKVKNKTIRAYYDEINQYSHHRISHETAVRTAFQNLLANTAKSHKWLLVPELSDRTAGRLIRPDGTIRDNFNIPRGYWEAKDTDDNLETEITKKIRKGYPTSNIIFEDTKQAILYQNDDEFMRGNLADPKFLGELINIFFSYRQPDIEQFEKAVDEFKIQVPVLAQGLLIKISEAHSTNKQFINAFGSFFSLCQEAINANIRREAVDEMLVQHLLTERLIRTIFDNAEFTKRNVIASEVEKVIDALVSKSFNRHEFLKSLDRFYIAIESAARGMQNYADKQHFLNTVYERFFQGYSVKVADTHGIVYTPQPIVDFMCASIEEILECEFGRKLYDDDIFILDPCTGTGNFIINIMRKLPRRKLELMYKSQLFANEVMLLPYYIAALNIEHAFYERQGGYIPFEGLCFVDTLDMTGHQLGFINEKNAERVERQRHAPITVILGNPPYNVGQLNENDNNKNRKYEIVDRSIRDTYAKDSQASLKAKLYDPYVKFFKWAVNRLENRDGIVCFVSNNSFIDQITFDGMRKHLQKEFSLIYHIDLHGKIRDNPKLSGTIHNVFGVQVGVGITLAIKNKNHKETKIYYHRVPEDWRKEEKLKFLTDTNSVKGVKWKRLRPDSRYNWIIYSAQNKYSEFLPIGSKNARIQHINDESFIFTLYSLGVATNRDEWAYDFTAKGLSRKMERHIENYNYEIFRLSQEKNKPNSIDNFVNNEPSFLKWTDRLKESLRKGRLLSFSEDEIRDSMYRPFTKKKLYFDHLLNQRTYQLPRIFPNKKSETENKCICVPSVGYRANWAVFICNIIPCLTLTSVDGYQCFPYYIYDNDGTNRHENITAWALNCYREHYNDKNITKWDIFYYIYGLFHHPEYRKKYCESLKRELPRIPYASDYHLYKEAGKKLCKLHLNYEAIKPYDLKFIEAKDVPFSYKVIDKMRLDKNKTSIEVNPSLTLSGIPKEAFEYQLGNRSALEWIIDQYQVFEHKRSKILSDPNRQDDEEYIVRLLGQVISVSLQTMDIVKSLPKSFES